MAKFLVGAPSDMANQWYTSRGALKKQLAPMNGVVVPYCVSGTTKFSSNQSLMLLTYGALCLPQYRDTVIIQKSNTAYSLYDSRIVEPKSRTSVRTDPNFRQSYIRLPGPGGIKKPLMVAGAFSISNSLDVNGSPCNITNDGEDSYESYGATCFTNIDKGDFNTNVLCFDILEFLSSKKTISYSIPVNGQDQLFEFNLLRPALNENLLIGTYTVPSYGAVGVNTNKTVFAYVTNCVKTKNSFIINFKTSKTNKLCIGATLFLCC